MARNGSGTYSVPNTFVSGTRVLTADVNTNFSDIGTALTGSLALDGQSQMTGQLKGAAGTVSAPGYAWANELGSGWYRAGAGDFRYAVAGADVLKVTASGLEVTGALSGTLTITDGSITTAKLAAGAATPPKVAMGAWTTVASAGTVDLGAQTSLNIVISGTTAITSFGTTATTHGLPYYLRFSGALTLTNGANLILPGGANITTAAGDIAEIVWDGSNVWRVVDYTRASGAALAYPNLAVPIAALNASGTPSNANFLRGDGSWSGAGGITLGTAVNTTSGTAVDFTGIPSTAKRVTVILAGVSTTGSSGIQLQIGAGSIATSGYASGNGSADGGGYAGATSTTSFTMLSRNTGAATIRHGSVVLTNVTGNTWVATVAFGGSDTSLGCVGGGTLALGAALDRVRLSSINGTDTFDAGTVNIMWES